MRQKALIIGINSYPYLGSLKSPAKDAEAIKRIFDQYPDLPWDVERWPPVGPNGTVNEDLVKEDDLFEVIRDLFCPKSSDDPYTALLFFSGHGHRNDNKEVFLATSDTNRDKKWGITLECLHDLLLESNVRRQIVWLDCCHAGELINFNWTEEKWKKWSAEGDRFLVAACAAHNKAYAVDGHGLLTRILLEALQEELEMGLISSWTVARFIRNCQDNRLRNQNPLVKHYGDEILFWQGKRIKKAPFKGAIALEEIQNLAPLNNSPAVPEERNVNSSDKLNESKLYEALLKLDYDDQDTVFKYCLRKHKIGCFRIEYTRHGGQGLLLNRFIKYATQNTGIEELIIPLGRQSIKSDFYSILKAIATFVGAEKPYQSSTIAAKISQRLSSQNLIVILDDFQLLPREECLALQKFWQDLVDYLPQSQYLKKRMLMFWIERPDDKSPVDDFFVTEIDNWQPQMPVKLAIKNCQETKHQLIDETALRKWLDNIFDCLSTDFINNIENDIDLILSSHRQDLPELVIRRICGLFQCDWHKIESWLKI